MSQDILTLTVIIIFCHPVETVKSFYVRHFNLMVVEEIKDQWVVLNAGNMEIALHKVGREHIPKGSEKFEAVSNTKVGFHVTGDLKSLHQNLLTTAHRLERSKELKASLRDFVMEKGSGGECFQLIQQINLQVNQTL